MGSNARYGERLLPEIIDETARNEPTRTVFKIAVSPHTYSAGCRNVTYAEFARACDRFAWFLHKNLGKPAKPAILGYIGPNDIRYFIGIIGAIKAGYALLLPSPRNSTSNHLHVIAKTGCTSFLKAKESHIDHIILANPTPLGSIDIPELNDLLGDEAIDQFTWNPSYEEVKHQLAVVLHSSGSTGQVKPIKLTHKAIAGTDRQHLIKYGSNAPLFIPYAGGDGSNTFFSAMPYFHAAGVFTGLLINIFFRIAFVAIPQAAPINILTTLNTLEHTSPTIMMAPPSILEEMTGDERALELCSRLDLCVYAGGALSDYASDIISKRANLFSYIASTESLTYPLSLHEDPSKTYSYIRIIPELEGIEFRPIGDELYQLFLTRDMMPEWSSIFEVYPEKQEYDTSDIWQKHPTLPGYWKYASRADDVIVLSNGEKVVASTTESILHECPIVHEAILYGNKKFQIAVIVEVETSQQTLSRDEALNRLEPYLDKANGVAPSHAQLQRDFVIFTNPAKPLSRSAKGTVARVATYRTYEQELDQLYSHVAIAHDLPSPLITNVDYSTTVSELSCMFGSVCGLVDLAPDADFLISGVDSLQIITLTRHIAAKLRAEEANVHIERINPGFIYSHPTIAQLAQGLRHMESPGQDEQAAEHTRVMDDMLARHTRELPIVAHGDAVPAVGNFNVALTGSTGSLGSYLLASLLKNPEVKSVFVLNRATDGLEAQREAFEARRLIRDLDRVRFLHADLSQDRFGLHQTVYDDLVASVHIFVHNAWPVNFNIPLSTFESHIGGISNVIKFAVAGQNRPVILFTSSIATTANWHAIHPGTPVPEREISDSRVPGLAGYGSSKWMAERMLSQVARTVGVRNAIVRVGQLGGSVSDASPSVWNKWEWFPSMIISSAFLGKIPGDLGVMDSVNFVPLDQAAESLIELAMDAASAPTAYTDTIFNLVNANQVKYKHCVSMITHRLRVATGREIKIVPLPAWVASLTESAKDLADVDVEKNPGVKLIDFYQNLVRSNANTDGNAHDAIQRFVTVKTRMHSQTMRELGGVTQDWIEKWLQGWDF